MIESVLCKFPWTSTDDGFSLCRSSIAEILTAWGIDNTGISSYNPQDVCFYYDDWYIFRITDEESTFGLVKLREQEFDYKPGFADGDNPGITISFIRFDVESLTDLYVSEKRNEEVLKHFVNVFRNVTERSGQKHDPFIQHYFSNVKNTGVYLIAEAYVEKISKEIVDGKLSFPKKMCSASRRVTDGLMKLNQQAGRMISDLDNKMLCFADEEQLSYDEKCSILATHTANLTFNSFAAEVRFHSDALISIFSRLPIVGRKIWYESAIRADMQIEKDKLVAIMTGMCPYHNLNSRIVREQNRIHGKK